MCFGVFECAGTDIVNMDKTVSKPTNRARDWKSVQKPESRKLITCLILQVFRIVIYSPWENFSELAEMAP